MSANLSKDHADNLRRLMQFRALWWDERINSQKLFDQHASRLLAALGGLGAVW